MINCSQLSSLFLPDFNSNIVKLTASHSSKRSIVLSYSRSLTKGHVTLALRPGGSQATGSKATLWLLICFKNLLKTHMHPLANSHLHS